MDSEAHTDTSTGGTLVFEKFADWVSNAVGTAGAFAIAVALTLTWALIGPLLHWSNTWQLIANTTTTIVTWLMIFVLQHTQNRDTKRIIALLEKGVNND